MKKTSQKARNCTTICCRQEWTAFSLFVPFLLGRTSLMEADAKKSFDDVLSLASPRIGAIHSAPPRIVA